MLSAGCLIAVALVLVGGVVVVAVVWTPPGSSRRMRTRNDLQESQTAYQEGDFWVRLAIGSATRSTRCQNPWRLCCWPASQPAKLAGWTKQSGTWKGCPTKCLAVEEGIFLRGELPAQSGRLSDAENQFRGVLRKDPQSFEAHHRLAHLYTAEGRYWDAVPELLFLVQSGRFTQHELELLGGTRVWTADDQELLRYLEKCRTTPRSA